MPITPFIGVRISWLIVARKRALRLVRRLRLRARLLRLGEKSRVAQRDADVGGDRLQQPLVVLAEDAFALGALHADHAFGAAFHGDRHAEIRARLPCRRALSPSPAT